MERRAGIAVARDIEHRAIDVEAFAFKMIAQKFYMLSGPATDVEQRLAAGPASIRNDLFDAQCFLRVIFAERAIERVVIFRRLRVHTERSPLCRSSREPCRTAPKCTTFSL